MYASNLIEEKNKWRFDSYLGYNTGWRHYYHDYRNAIDCIVESIEKGKHLIDSIALPLMFLIRHSLELGLKVNILFLEEINPEIEKIELKGQKSHSLERLYNKFISHIEAVKQENKIDIKIIQQMNAYLIELNQIKDKLHFLDHNAYSFRYPVDSEGNPNIEWKERIDISDIVNAFRKAQPVLLHTQDVLSKELKRLRELRDLRA